MTRSRALLVADAFSAVVGARPQGVWSAPGRVNLMGEHTDYNGGLALPIALPHRTYVAASRRTDTRVRMWSAQTGGPIEIDLREVRAGHPANWSAYAVGVPWALLRDLPSGPSLVETATSGLDLVIDSDVPVGAGLSSSAALGCAVGAALADLWGLDLLRSDDGRRVIVTAARAAENIVAGAPTGGMDQSAAMLARDGHALLLDCRADTHSHVPVTLARAGLSLLVIDTRAHHALNDGQYADRRAACERASAALGVSTLRELSVEALPGALADIPEQSDRARVRHVVTEIGRVATTVEALMRGDFARVGEDFVASHTSLRDDYEVSCPELDLVVACAMDAGALGARMTGGGFGGSAIALVETSAAGEISALVTRAFAARQWRAPASFTCLPSGPAGRDC